MNVSLALSLWFVLLVLTCCGNAGSHEEELTTDDYAFPTATADYDYTATFDYDYYYVTAQYEISNKAAGIGLLTPVLLLGLVLLQIWN